MTSGVLSPGDFQAVRAPPLSGPCQNPPISFDRAVNQKLSLPLVPNPKLLHSNPGLTSWLPFLCRDQARLKLNRVQKATDRVVGIEAQSGATITPTSCASSGEMACLAWKWPISRPHRRNARATDSHFVTG